jgi:iron complex transport system substrate-binding protein
MRIVTLIPSLTEIVAVLGRGHQLVGVSHECDFPADVVANLPRLTSSRVHGTQSEIDAQVSASVAEGRSLYSVDVWALLEARPTHILTQALCEVCAVSVDDVRAVIAEQRALWGTVLVPVNPTTIEEVFQMILEIGGVLGVDAAPIVAELRGRWNGVSGAPGRVAFLEWTDPPFTGGHWVSEQIVAAGGVDALGAPGVPSARISWDEIIASQPDVVVVGPCGFDLDAATAAGETIVPRLADTPAGRYGRIYAVNANAEFSRPGPRLVDGAQTLAAILADRPGRWRRIERWLPHADG